MDQMNNTEGKHKFFVRFCFYLAGLIGFILYVLTKYGWFMLGHPEEQRNTAYSRQTPTERGAIVDRNGRLLAVETKLGIASLLKSEISAKNSQTGETTLDMAVCRDISEKLSPLLGMPQSEISTLIISSTSDYVVLKRNIEESAAEKIRAAKAGRVSDEDRARINALYKNDPQAFDKAINEAEAEAYTNRTNLDKVRLDVAAARVYPEKMLASQIIGIMGKDRGIEGLEWAFEKDLRASNGENGKQLTLTIDVIVQHYLEQIAADALEQNKAQSVMITAMDPRTGEILGSASLPHFDPNSYNAYPGVVWRYQPALYAYEPGSVFKVFSVAALLDSGAITDNSTFNCTGSYTSVRPPITDLAVHGVVNAERIIALSCNVGVSLASDHIESKPFYDKIHSFGFGQLVGSGSPSETAGIFREDSNRRFKPTLAIGQGISVSMLQMLQAASAVANGGILSRPKLVLKLTAPDGTETPFPAAPSPPRRVLRAETASALLRYMRAAAAVDGTGWRAAIGDIPMAVKTGTAQMAEGGTYSQTDFIASCMAIFPANDPRLILYAVIVKPQGESYLGGRIATIPIRKAAESLADYLKLSRGKNPAEDRPNTVYFNEESPLPELGSVMPDFRGYSKSSLIPLFETDTGYLIQLEGNGHVKAQNPPAGTELVHGDVITLYLE